MKKIFTLALAAAATIGASAAQPVSIERNTAKDFIPTGRQLKVEEFTSVKNVKVVNSRADEIDVPATAYINMYQNTLRLNQSSAPVYDGMWAQGTSTITIKDGNATITNPFGYVQSQFKEGVKVSNMVGTVQNIELSSGNTIPALAIEVGQVVIDATGAGVQAKWYVALVDYDNGSLFINSDPSDPLCAYMSLDNVDLMTPITITLKTDKGERQCILGVIQEYNGQYYLDQSGPNYMLAKPNATFSGTQVTQNGNKEFSTPIFAMENEQTGVITVSSLTSFGQGCFVNITPGNGSSYEIKSYPSAYIEYDSDLRNFLNFTILYAPNGADGNLEDNTPLTLDKNTLTFDGPFVEVDETNGYYFGPFEDAKIELSAVAGIDNVTAVDNTNAPVEYFNLQGMRINEPTAGQVVIRRQGTEVSKYIVR